MRWKLPQQYEHIGRPSLSLRWRTRLSQRGQRKKLQEPPFGKRRWASLTSRLSSTAPKPIHTLVMSAVILPSARSRETLSDDGRVSSNNLCVAIPLQYHRAVGERNNEKKQYTIDEPKLFGPSAGFWAEEIGPRAAFRELRMSDADEFGLLAQRYADPLVLKPDRVRGPEARYADAHEFIEEEAVARVASG
jgi:hypothetical protein